MRLAALLVAAGLDGPVEVHGGAHAEDVEVGDIVLDSRTASAGSLFCCIAGSRVDGHELAGAAAAAGAVAVLAERRVDVPASVAQVLVPSVRGAVGRVASAFHGHPSRQLTVVGVTGTNGKTTTTHLLRSVFQANGRKAAVIGTLTSGPGAPPTTPDAPALQEQLAGLRDDGTTFVAMEVSSHGLEMRRVDGTWFAATAFTNLSQDHLDLHGTMEAYFAAKARLFTPAFTDLAVVNLDDQRGRLLLDAATVRTVGWSLADVEVLGLEPSGSSLRWRGTELRVPLAGRLNVANAVGAATIAAELGLTPAQIAIGLAAAPPVRGRFEPVLGSQPFSVVVDYAHSPDGLEHLLTSARELVEPGRRVIVVFGAGGDRDPRKRPRMGEVTARLADVVVVTSDNPRGEDPASIIDAIVGGMAAEAAAIVEPDRRAAVERALALAEPGDLVVLAGKGHETTQTSGDRVVPFDDATVARELLLAAGHAMSEDGHP
ncbi:MAG: UDP-N-acetylmuramoyl-L-alanyl-D-glutamate--2,6-diaminopimelate ligase [Acidimicrobiia bacterium]|nr:UDP-N-acetylmuramoyl-L-alanyl-D-glutamate--2,6-diaminopimelate ligase [Acidimicrobiia bacterium]